MAVSYTHLDVYKRQPNDLSIPLEGPEVYDAVCHTVCTARTNPCTTAPWVQVVYRGYQEDEEQRLISQDTKPSDHSHDLANLKFGYESGKI